MNRFEKASDAIFYVIDAVVVILNRTGQIEEFNPAAERLTGYSTAEVISKPVWELFIPPEQRKTVEEVFENLKAGNFPNQHDNYWLTKDGKRKLIHWANTALLDDSGQVQYVIASGIDITEKDEYEKQLKTTLENQRVLVELLEINFLNKPLKDLLEKALDIILSVPWIALKPQGAIFMKMPNQESLKLIAQKNLNEQLIYKCDVVPFGTCLCGRAAKTGKVQFSSCIDHRHNINFKDMPAHGHYCVPLLINHEVLGIMNLYVEDGHVQKDSEMEFLHIISNTLAGIIERKQTARQLSYQASHDTLTGLINRREFELKTEALLLSAKVDKTEHAMCFMDLDQFKIINDTCGHIAGDELLRQIARLLEDDVRDNDTLGRLGGDEFGVLMEHCSLVHAHRVADTLQKKIQNFEFFWEGQRFRIGISIGLVAITDKTLSFTELLKQADTACYVAKDLGRNRIHEYRLEDVELVQRHGEMQWVSRIHQALEEDRFCLYAQKIISLDKGARNHYELLLRMIDENGDIILPGVFLPAAERYNLMEILDTWVIKKAFTTIQKHPGFFEETGFISINLSGPSLTNTGFLEFIDLQFKKQNIDANKICFEITETAAISNLRNAIMFITRLKERGCRFALDDFGSGLSSFAYLKNFPVDYLKIDGMFVKDIVDDPLDYAMVKSINEIGHVMGIKTIAEFVENDEIKDMLKTLNVNFAQGYGIGKPEPLVELLTKL